MIWDWGKLEWRNYVANAKRLREFKLTIFGADAVGLEIMQALQQEGLAVNNFCDTDAGRIGQCVSGIPVISLDEVNRDNTKFLIGGSEPPAGTLCRLTGENIYCLFGAAKGLALAELPPLGYIQKYQPKPGDIVFDCGAFCGAFSSYFSKLVGETGKVYAFEPDEVNYSSLVKNIKINRLDNVVAINKGVWGTTTTLSFNSQGNESSAIAAINPGQGAAPVAIEVLSLEDAYKEVGLSRLDYIKMDIEGAGVETLSAARNFLKNKQINFAIASYHNYCGQQTWITLQKIFAEIGYSSETGYNEHLTTWAWK